jgi:hypothetical protein
MKRIFAAVIAFAASAMFATAQPAMQHHEPGLRIHDRNAASPRQAVVCR